MRGRWLKLICGRDDVTVMMNTIVYLNSLHFRTSNILSFVTERSVELRNALYLTE